MINAPANGNGDREYAFDFADDTKMLTHCAPVFILRSGVPFPNCIYANGTVALIDTGRRKLFVTCDHVWSEFANFRKDNADARMAVICRTGACVPIYIDDATLIDCDKELDLAVFDANSAEKTMIYKEFYKIYRFPIADPKPGKPISFIGFPAEARRVTEELGNFGYSSFGLIVSDVSDSMILLANNDPRILRDNRGNQAPPGDIGGMSGAPAYVRPLSGGFDLAGFVRAGDRSDTDIRLSKASFLREDGSLFRPAWHRFPTP
jgi:hypothetical protein